jgi:hypothetical protein
MFGSLLAGLISGFVLGFLGAGGTVVGLPFLLIFDRLGPHNALGTNALGVSLIAAALLIWRIRNKQILLTSGVMFALPGLVGVMQGPGSPDEDRRGGFGHGGWAVSRGDEARELPLVGFASPCRAESILQYDEPRVDRTGGLCGNHVTAIRRTKGWVNRRCLILPKYRGNMKTIQ